MLLQIGAGSTQASYAGVMSCLRDWGHSPSCQSPSLHGNGQERDHSITAPPIRLCVLRSERSALSTSCLRNRLVVGRQNLSQEGRTRQFIPRTRRTQAGFRVILLRRFRRGTRFVGGVAVQELDRVGKARGAENPGISSFRNVSRRSSP